MTQTIQSLDIKSCPNDMKQADEIIKAFHAHKVQFPSPGTRKENEQKEC